MDRTKSQDLDYSFKTEFQLHSNGFIFSFYRVTFIVFRKKIMGNITEKLLELKFEPKKFCG